MIRSKNIPCSRETNYHGGDSFPTHPSLDYQSLFEKGARACNSSLHLIWLPQLKCTETLFCVKVTFKALLHN